MSNWFPLVHYGIFVLPAAFVALGCVLKWRPSLANMTLALAVLIIIPALYAALLHHQDANHEALALAGGLMGGYIAGFAGRYLRRTWQREDDDVPALNLSRPAPSIPPEAWPDDQPVFEWSAEQALRHAEARDRPGGQHLPHLAADAAHTEDPLWDQRVGSYCRREPPALGQHIDTTT